MSTLMFWNKQNGNSTQNGNDPGLSAKNGKKTWLHSPDALMNGHVAYLVKFLGSTAVDQAKGIETVKDAIRKLQFSQQMKKAESGSNVKTKKVEITISVDGVAVQEPRSSKILHQFPLHNISYCADEKGVKKFFSFIAKNVTPSDSSDRPMEETHECFVFISSKLASDITLTIGQAFELAYRRYVNESGKTTEVSKLQSQNKYLEQKVEAYCQRLKDVIDVIPKTELDRLLNRYGVRDILDVPQQENGIGNHVANISGSNTPDLGIDVSSPNNDDQLLIETTDKHFAPIVPPRNLQSQISSTLDALKPSVGTKLEGLLLNSDSDSDFDPRADENDIFSPEKNASESFFGFEPPKTTMGQQLFTLNSNSMTNGSTNGNMNNGASRATPLLAPPPKASVPRRIGNVAPNQDLFGSMPFEQQSSPFDIQNGETVSGMTWESIGLDAAIYNTIQKQAFEFIPTINSNNNIDDMFSSYCASSNKSEMNNCNVFAMHDFSNMKNPFIANENKSIDLRNVNTENNEENNANVLSNRDQSGPKYKVQKETSVHLFKDVAKAAFNEFNYTRHKSNEFFNEICEFEGARI